MKRSPEMQRLEEILRGSPIVAGGFLGSDDRPIEEIIEADAAELERLGYTPQQVANRMTELTSKAREGLGNSVQVNDRLEVRCDDNRGQLVCPWPTHELRTFKTVTTATRLDSGKSLQWSDLSIHLIADHGFFEGRGSHYRLEPHELIEIIFA